MPCLTETPLVEGVDYNIDPVNGMIMFLSTGALGGGIIEDANTCGVTLTGCCQASGCLYNSDLYACDNACYVFDGYDTVMQEGSEPYRSGDEKMIKRVMVEAEPLPQSTPSPIECDVAYGNQPSCMTWVSTRPLDFECQSEKTAVQHAAARTRPDGVFSFPTWRRGQYISTRFRITGVGGGGTFSALHKIILGWGQAESP